MLIGKPGWVIDHVNNGNPDLSEADTKRRHDRWSVGPGEGGVGGEKMNTKEELKRTQ